MPQIWPHDRAENNAGGNQADATRHEKNDERSVEIRFPKFRKPTTSTSGNKKAPAHIEAVSGSRPRNKSTCAISTPATKVRTTKKTVGVAPHARKQPMSTEAQVTAISRPRTPNRRGRPDEGGDFQRSAGLVDPLAQGMRGCGLKSPAPRPIKKAQTEEECRLEQLSREKSEDQSDK